MSFWVGFLAFLWPQVAKKHGISEIRVFLGRILAFLWPQVVKKQGVSEICVFLGQIFGISLASGSEETGCFRNSCLSGLDEFCSVGELSCWGCELETEWQIVYPSVTGKVRKLRQSEPNLVNFWFNFGVRRPHSV